MARVIAVVSAKGGAGKSTVSAGLGRALSGRGFRVLLVDMDAALRSLDILLNVGDKLLFDWGDVLSGGCEGGKALIKAGDNLFLLGAPAAALSVDRQAFAAMITDYAAIFDFIILDSPAGLEQGFMLSVLAAGEALIVATPDDISIRAAATAAERVQADGDKSCRLVINRYRYAQSPRGIDSVIDGTAVRLIGVVPEDAALTLVAAGQPLSRSAPSTGAFLRIAGRLLGEKVPLQLKEM